ncbi:MAG: GntR family transcriptional regulator [Frankia sp.]|nr:GntR family transcriptional regulator [Frankia sp.]
MTADIAPTVDEIHRGLLDRILTGYYPAGSKLPSVRALAQELRSNPSTVDRAIGRLVAAGRLRTVARRGVFVEPNHSETVESRSVVARQLDEVLLRARRLGLTAAELAALVGDALARVDALPRIAVVECNERDLRQVQDAVRRATGVEVAPVLLQEAAGRRLDEEFDAVAVPIFHLNDVDGLVADFDRVVELNLVASPTALRGLIEVRDQERIVVVAPSRRGVQWMTAVVGQYFPGRIDAVQVGVDDPRQLVGEPVVVVNNAAELAPEIIERIGRVIPIEWELDPRFQSSLHAQVAAVTRKRAS